MRRLKSLLTYIFTIKLVYCGTVSALIDYQLYKDFAMNKGQFKVGAVNVKVTRKDGSFKIIEVPILDFSSTDSSAVGTLVDPNYVAGVKHNRGYTTVKYGYDTGHTYKLIDRNEKSNRDYHTPRLNKVVTDVAPTKYKQDDTLVQDWKNKYSMFARVGSGLQYIQSENGDKTYEAYAYQYLTGGLITSDMLYKGIWVDDRGENMNSYLDKSPLPIYIEQGDSGSPLWGFNNETQEWELVAFGMAISATVSIYIPVDREFMEQVMQEDYLPEVKDLKAEGEIVWGAAKTEEGSNTGTGTITQGDSSWTYNGLKSDLDLSKATNDELNYTKHLTFAGEGGTIKLEDSINMGAGKLTFKNDYTVKGETGNETWVGAGIEIDKGKEVLWQVNGVAGDALHKIGEGTLHVNATGINQGALNVGDGTVILNQQADADGNKQAFDYIDIVSGRATVVLNDAEQIDTSKINFLFRGGRLDVNGNEIEFGDINAVDSGAMIVNHNGDKKAIINIDTDKFKRDASIYHGQFGESDEDRVNGEMDINIGGESKKTFAITGGSNIKGDINVSNTDLILSGGRDLHAGEKIKDTTVNGDYYYSEFNVENINLSEGSSLHESIYSVVNGNINTTKDNEVVIGYVEGETEYVYDETQETKTQTAIAVILSDLAANNRFNEVTTYHSGDINLQDNSQLKIGYAYVDGDITSEDSEIVIKDSAHIGDIELSNSKFVVSNTPLEGKLSSSNSEVNISDSLHEGDISLSNSNLVVSNTVLKGKILSQNSEISLSNSGQNGDINLKDSSLKVVSASIDGDITSENSRVNLKDSKLKGSIMSDSTVNLDGSEWDITGTSQVGDLNLNDAKLVFDETGESGEFHTLTADRMSGTGSIFFNADMSNGKINDKVFVKKADGDIDLKIDIRNSSLAKSMEYGKDYLFMTISDIENSRVTVSSFDGKNYLDMGPVRVQIEEKNGNVIVSTPDYFRKESLSDLSNAVVSEYSARVTMLKNQTSLLRDSMSDMAPGYFQEGASYIGNYSSSKYESDKFREYEQRIITHGFTYETVEEQKTGHTLYDGKAFIYGKSNIAYDGDYSGKIENYSLHSYSKLYNDKGYFVKRVFGVNYLDGSINSGDYESYAGNMGTGFGMDRDLKYMKLTTGVDLTLYYLPKTSYTLEDRHNDEYRVTSNKEIIFEINPEVRAETEFWLSKLRVNTYGTLSYEFNKYLLNNAPKMDIHDISTTSGVAERGTVTKIGTDIKIENIGVGLELKYFSGSESSEKVTGTVKASYKF